MSANIDWASWWGLFDKLDPERKNYAATQLAGAGFEDFMQSRSAPILTEVLSNAPVQLVESYLHLLPKKFAYRVVATLPKSQHARVEFGYFHPPLEELFEVYHQGDLEGMGDLSRRVLNEMGADALGKDFARIEIAQGVVSQFEFQRVLRRKAHTQGNPILSARLRDKPTERIFYAYADDGNSIATYRPRTT